MLERVVDQPGELRRARRASGFRLITCGALALALSALPTPAFACPICGVTNPNDNWPTYLAMSAMISALPLTMIGGIVFWIYRRANAK